MHKKRTCNLKNFVTFFHNRERWVVVSSRFDNTKLIFKVPLALICPIGINPIMALNYFRRLINFNFWALQSQNIILSEFGWTFKWMKWHLTVNDRKLATMIIRDFHQFWLCVLITMGRHFFLHFHFNFQ